MFHTLKQTKTFLIVCHLKKLVTNYCYINEFGGINSRGVTNTQSLSMTNIELFKREKSLEKIILPKLCGYLDSGLSCVKSH